MPSEIPTQSTFAENYARAEKALEEFAFEIQSVINGIEEKFRAVIDSLGDKKIPDTSDIFGDKDCPNLLKSSIKEENHPDLAELFQGERVPRTVEEALALRDYIENRSISVQCPLLPGMRNMQDINIALSGCAARKMKKIYKKIIPTIKDKRRLVSQIKQPSLLAEIHEVAVLLKDVVIPDEMPLPPCAIPLDSGCLSLDELRIFLQKAQPTIVEAGQLKDLADVLSIIKDIRSFLRAAVENGIYIPVMLKKQTPQISRIKKTLSACGVDHREVDDLDPSNLKDFVMSLAKAKHYFAGLTINGKRICGIRSAGSRIVYGEGKGILIATDIDGQDSVLKFVAPRMCDFTTSRLNMSPSVERLYKEFDIIKAIGPVEGIPRAYEKAETEIAGGEKIFYTTTEFFEGVQLNELLTSGIPFVQAIKIIRSLLSSLGHLHKKGYIHNDISDNNVIVSADGRAGLVDFGGAVEIGTQKPKSEHGVILGTPPYIPYCDCFIDKENIFFRASRPLFMVARDLGWISKRKMPHNEYSHFLKYACDDHDKEYIVEIFKQYYCPANPIYDARKDIYAVGVLLFQILEALDKDQLGSMDSCNLGKAMGSDDMRAYNLARIRKGRYPSIASQSSQVRHQLADIIGKATKLNYRERYSSAAEMLADIEKIQLVQDSR